MKNLKEITGKKMAEWKEDIEELKQQLEHTAEEAEAAFEKQKNNLVDWLDDTKKKLDELEDVAEERTENLKTKLDDLRVQAALGKAETRSALQEQQHRLRRKMQSFKMALADMEKNTEAKTSSFLKNAVQRLDKFEAKLEMTRWQLAERKEEAIQFFKEKKDAIALRLKKLGAKLNEVKQDTAENWEIFSKKMNRSWMRLNTAIAKKKEDATYLSDLHFDHRQWQSEIEFWEDELDSFKHQLERVVAVVTDKDAKARIEHFQNAFEVHRQEVDELENEIIRHEIRLAHVAKGNISSVDKKTFGMHAAMRGKMDTQRKLFRELKEDFFQFLKPLVRTRPVKRK